MVGKSYAEADGGFLQIDDQYGVNVLFCYLGQNSGGLILLQCDVTLFVCVLHPFIAALFAGSVPFYRSRLELTTWNLVDSCSVSESFKVLVLGFNPNNIQGVGPWFQSKQDAGGHPCFAE
jgi:hypothetical protein